MKIPTPVPGLVIRYAFLWKEEFDKGQYEGGKDRPCAIVVASKIVGTNDIQVIVAPITHTLPENSDSDASLEIPSDVARKLGLDKARHWVRVRQLNRFVWPGYDLRPRTDLPERIDYGMITEEFFNRLKAAILSENQRKKIPLTPRDD